LDTRIAGVSESIFADAGVQQFAVVVVVVVVSNAPLWDNFAGFGLQMQHCDDGTFQISSFFSVFWWNVDHVFREQFHWPQVKSFLIPVLNLGFLDFHQHF
jgi:hypothetical protein